jgi:hypothetical protein
MHKPSSRVETATPETLHTFVVVDEKTTAKPLVDDAVKFQLPELLIPVAGGLKVMV